MKRLLQLLSFLLAATLLFTACATPARNEVLYGFQFNLTHIEDKQNVGLLDYHYGPLKTPGTHMTDYAKNLLAKEGRLAYGNGSVGYMPRGEFLYVKWRNLTTKQEFEDRVDLTQRLPPLKEMENGRLTFLIHYDRLHIYFVFPDRRDPSAPPVGPSMTEYRRTIQIYPDLPSTNNLRK